ncbi:MAG: MGMT family protein [Parcubacteria group bacterium]|nr:MGMT family protein [Parcubacteria group bacterium]
MNFSQKVHREVSKIPRGRVATYKSIAIALGAPRASRAVAMALSRNFDPSVPCYRVVRSDGRLGGYNRGGLAKKAQLLRGEGVGIRDQRVDLKEFSI